MLQIVKIYNLSSDTVLRQQLKWYNTPKWNFKIGEFMAREKILKDKKIQLVLQYINNEKTIKEIASKNSIITNGQLRDWIRKYKIHCDRALNDKRRNIKNQAELSEEEILKRKNKELEKNKKLEAKLLLIKKLIELKGDLI